MSDSQATPDRVDPYLDDGDLCLYHGDALTVLRSLPTGIAQTCITSPPYWGLRDYNTGTWRGGDAECDHLASNYDRGVLVDASDRTDGGGASAATADKRRTPYRDTCGKCGARRVDDQLGLEATPDEYVAKLVEVFREVRRILRDDGTLWLNLGDSYAGAGYANHKINGPDWYDAATLDKRRDRQQKLKKAVEPMGLKPKDLVGIPWRVAFALQADGWYLRSDIIWSKPNPMPESVTDRPTKAHEYVFLFSKQPRYYWDADAVREPPSPVAHHNGTTTGPAAEGPYSVSRSGHVATNPAGRNLRSVWQIATEPFPEAHFATYPQELVRRCILAGTSERGECAECGAPWRRVTAETDAYAAFRKRAAQGGYTYYREGDRSGDKAVSPGRVPPKNTTIGWEPSCSCPSVFHDREQVGDSRRVRPQLVLDPFVGSGTTSLVARKHGRRSLGIDLSAEYLEIAARRTQQLSLLGAVP